MISAENRELVARALAHMNEGETISVNELVGSHCGGTVSQYEIAKFKNALQISAKIKIAPGDGEYPNVVAEGLTAISHCMRPINSVWAQYGIDLDVSFTGEETELPGQRVVRVYKKNIRSNEAEWHIASPFLCQTINHELGHHLGFADEYAESGTCRKKEFEATEKNVLSFMKGVDGCRDDECLQRGTFYPRHLATLLAPVYDDPADLLPRQSEFTLTANRDVKIKNGEMLLKRNDPNTPSSCRIRFYSSHLFNGIMKAGTSVNFAIDIQRRSETGQRSTRVVWDAYRSYAGGNTARMECEVQNGSWRKAAMLLKPIFSLERQP